MSGTSHFPYFLPSLQLKCELLGDWALIHWLEPMSRNYQDQKTNQQVLVNEKPAPCCAWCCSEGWKLLQSSPKWQEHFSHSSLFSINLTYPTYWYWIKYPVQDLKFRVLESSQEQLCFWGVIRLSLLRMKWNWEELFCSPKVYLLGTVVIQSIVK